MSLATITHCFPNKDALVDACMDSLHEAMGDMRERLLPLSLQARSAEDVVTMLVREAMRFVRQHVTEARLAMRSVVDTGRANRRLQGAYLIRVRALVMEACAVTTGVTRKSNGFSDARLAFRRARAPLLEPGRAARRRQR